MNTKANRDSFHNQGTKKQGWQNLTANDAKYANGERAVLREAGRALSVRFSIPNHFVDLGTVSPYG
jgi:hypothetical protein